MKRSWINERTLVPPRCLSRNVSQERWDSMFGPKEKDPLKDKTKDGDASGRKKEVS